MRVLISLLVVLSLSLIELPGLRVGCRLGRLRAAGRGPRRPGTQEEARREATQGQDSVKKTEKTKKNDPGFAL